MTDTLLLGAVAYDPKVVTIWDGFQRWFAARGLPFDYVLYTNYERQVEQHFAGAFHVAWNSPLAWLQAQRVARARGRDCRAVAMRDTDQDLTSVVVVRADAPIRSVADLRGKRLGVGAGDSPQATMIPLQQLAEHGLVGGRDCEVHRFDVLVGKHGDHVGGERDAAKALMRGEVDAACMIDGNHLLFAQEGTLPRGQTRVLLQTGPYDHCNFTVLDGAPAALLQRFTDLLFGMRYDDAEVRPLLDLEGLKAWRPGRTSGYALLERGCEQFGWLQPFLRHMAAG
ncbi:MAG: phosphate/phosphite/phosphonate ABC transporter substrate-binding protein [Planctomycetota bacterium]|jgi:phosphonate transport system substrate-binding protein